MKIMTVVGTRPEIIRLSRVIPLLDGLMDQVLVHTGQNWDRSLSDIFFEELDVRPPDHHLSVDTASLGSVLADTLIKTESVLRAESPDAFLILGDTNSAISAVMAKRMGIPVYHMEAGNRSFDPNVPEEVNRRMVDHVADFNLAYTEHARRNLLAEGIHPRTVAVTGSPMKEILSHYWDRILDSDILEREGLRRGQFFLVSAHRQENVDSIGRLTLMLETLSAIQRNWGLPVVITTHPRMRQRLLELGVDALPNELIFHEPFGFIDYVKLQVSAKCVLSDSGTIAEEASILGFPAVTIRDSMERPEALESGAVAMTGLREANVMDGIRFALRSNDGIRSGTVPEYDVPDTARRTANFILSTHHLHGFWTGFRS